MKSAWVLGGAVLQQASDRVTAMLCSAVAMLAGISAPVFIYWSLMPHKPDDELETQQRNNPYNATQRGFVGEPPTKKRLEGCSVENLANGALSLTQARGNYRAFGAREESMLCNVRSPLAEELPVQSRVE